MKYALAVLTIFFSLNSIAATIEIRGAKPERSLIVEEVKQNGDRFLVSDDLGNSVTFSVHDLRAEGISDDRFATLLVIRPHMKVSCELDAQSICRKPVVTEDAETH